MSCDLGDLLLNAGMVIIGYGIAGCLSRFRKRELIDPDEVCYCSHKRCFHKEGGACNVSASLGDAVLFQCPCLKLRTKKPKFE